MCSCTLRPNKKIPVLRVTRPYLNLLVKPIIVFRISVKNIILWILKGKMPFKMYKIIFFPEKKKMKKKMCAYLPKISDLLPETHLFFYWPYLRVIRFYLSIPETKLCLIQICKKISLKTLFSCFANKIKQILE